MTNPDEPPVLSTDLPSIPDPVSLSSDEEAQQALQPQQQALHVNGNSANLEDQLEAAARLAWYEQFELEQLDELAAEGEQT